MNEKSIMLLHEIDRIHNKLKDTTLTLEEKSTLTTLKKEKIEELGKTLKLELEASESEYKSISEYRPITREERIEQQQKSIEQLKDKLKLYKKDKRDDSIIKSIIYVLGHEKEELKYLEERKDNTPVVDTNFWRYIREKYKRG